MRRYDSHSPGHRRRSLNIAAAARLLAEDSSFEGDEIQISNADKFHFVRRSAPSSSASVTRAGTPRRGLRGQRDMDERARGGVEGRDGQAAMSQRVGLDHGRGIKNVQLNVDC